MQTTFRARAHTKIVCVITHWCFIDSQWSAAVDDQVLTANIFGRGSIDLFGTFKSKRYVWENMGKPGNVSMQARYVEP